MSVKIQLTSDNKFFRKIISKYLFSKLEVLILSESKIRYKVWKIDRLPCDVDVDVDIDVGIDFEELVRAFLQINWIDTRSFSDQFIVSIISVDI